MGVEDPAPVGIGLLGEGVNVAQHVGLERDAGVVSWALCFGHGEVKLAAKVG